MDDITVRMCAFPARKGIGAEARMNKRNGRFHVHIFQVKIKLTYLIRREHSLINNRFCGQTGKIKIFIRTVGRIAYFMLGTFANDIQLPFEILLFFYAFVFFDKDLADVRHGLPCRFSDTVRKHRNIADAKQALLFFSNDFF